MAYPRRPADLETRTIAKRTGCGTMYVIITERGSRYFEIEARLGKTGGCASCHCASLTRMITVAINSGASIKRALKQIDGHTCPHSGGLDLSCPQAIANVIKETQLNQEKESGK